jgi:predicted lactoylglutathione lyase
MSTELYVNLPVKDLATSMDFFTKLGFSYDKRFTDEKAACLVIDKGLYAMLLTEPFFKTFTKKELADTATATEAILTLGVESRERVDELADKALASGGKPSKEPMEEGFMYGRSFQDPDGHLWEVFYMDSSAIPDTPGGE